MKLTPGDITKTACVIELGKKKTNCHLQNQEFYFFISWLAIVVKTLKMLLNFWFSIHACHFGDLPTGMLPIIENSNNL